MIDLQDRDEAFQQLKYHLSRVEDYKKTSADKHRHNVEFSVGDKVSLSFIPTANNPWFADPPDFICMFLWAISHH